MAKDEQDRLVGGRSPAKTQPYTTDDETPNPSGETPDAGLSQQGGYDQRAGNARGFEAGGGSGGNIGGATRGHARGDQRGPAAGGHAEQPQKMRGATGQASSGQESREEPEE